MLIKRYIYRLVLNFFLGATAIITTISAQPAKAADFILEDNLNLREFTYGLTNWPANKFLLIKSPLIDSPVGSIYISRSGYNEGNLAELTGDLLLSPFRIFGGLFGGDKPTDSSKENRGRVIANLWISRQGNCGLITILQKRFYGDQSDSEASSVLNAQKLQIGAGQEIITLNASGSPERFTRSQFRYTKCAKGQYQNCPEYTGEEFSLRRDWQLQQSDTRALASLPSGPFKVRYVFDTHTQIEEIKGGDQISKVYASCR